MTTTPETLTEAIAMLEALKEELEVRDSIYAQVRHRRHLVRDAYDASYSWHTPGEDDVRNTPLTEAQHRTLWET